jgi:RNA polymerase sigma-70 factor (ECF subfamily)
MYHRLVAERQLELVQGALAALPEKTRYVFLLHRFEGHTYATIAARLGLSAKAVEYHMSRALDAVMAATADFSGPDE